MGAADDGGRLLQRHSRRRGDDCGVAALEPLGRFGSARTAGRSESLGEVIIPSFTFLAAPAAGALLCLPLLLGVTGADLVAESGVDLVHRLDLDTSRRRERIRKGVVNEGISGNTIARLFCPTCGGHVYGHTSARPELRVVRLGALDDPSSVAPQQNIWTASAPSWACLDPSLEQFTGQSAPPPK